MPDLIRCGRCEDLVLRYNLPLVVDGQEDILALDQMGVLFLALAGFLVSDQSHGVSPVVY